MRGISQSMSILLWIIVLVLTVSALQAAKIVLEEVSEQEVTYGFTNFAKVLDDVCINGFSKRDSLKDYIQFTAPHDGTVLIEKRPVIPANYYICWECDNLLNAYNNAGLGPLEKTDCNDALCLVKNGKVLKSYPMKSCSFYNGGVETYLEDAPHGEITIAQGILLAYDGYSSENTAIEFSEESRNTLQIRLLLGLG